MTTHSGMRRGTNRAPREQGFVLATTALLLIPLLVFTAFAVDVGSWYYQATRQQQAADAAALAAVVWMPDVVKATAAAEEIAAANGFPAFEQQRDAGGALVFDAGGDPVYDLTKPYAQVTVEPVSAQSVKVRIELEGEVYFGAVVMDNGPQIARRSVAEYILPVPMGNPSSAIGTGNEPNPAGVQNMWLAVNSFCAGRSQGDPFSTRYLTSSFYCPGSNWTYRQTSGSIVGPINQGVRAQNPQYRPEGYYLIADMPAGSEAFDWRVEVFDAGICDIANETQGRTHDGAPLPATRVRGAALDMSLYAADDTPLSDTDNITPGNRVATTTFGLDDCGWQPFTTIGSGADRGRWVINYRSLARDNEWGLNYFSVRLVPTSGATAGQTCATSSNTWCPSLSALDYLPIYAPSTVKGTQVFAPGVSVNFFLAEIDDVHAGKTLVLELFDPGEGMENLQITGPSPTFTRYSFTYETTDCAVAGVCNDLGAAMTDVAETANANCIVSVIDTVTPATGTFPCLTVTGGVFNNRTVRMEIPIPGTYACTTDCWWRIRYQPVTGVSATDRTTWSAAIIGDPVRLVE